MSARSKRERQELEDGVRAPPLPKSKRPKTPPPSLPPSNTPTEEDQNLQLLQCGAQISGKAATATSSSSTSTST